MTVVVSDTVASSVRVSTAQSDLNFLHIVLEYYPHHQLLGETVFRLIGWLGGDGTGVCKVDNISLLLGAQLVIHTGLEI